MPPIEPLIYAELLSNIRQISILAFLDTPSDSATKAELLGDGTLLKLHHAKQDFELKTSSLELSWRLPLTGEGQRADVDIAQTIEAPWSSKDMVIGEQVLQCRKCSTTIVEADRIKEWRDLPSEGWAEMMDFWHCHKPSDHVNHSHEDEKQNNLASTKGYGANTKFTAQSGIGFVDHSSFLLAESDCNLPGGGNEIKRTISCENGSCLTPLGYSDPSNEGIRLFKWSLRMGAFENSLPSSLSDVDLAPSMASIISAQFLAIMNASCVSRLVLLPSPVTNECGPFTQASAFGYSIPPLGSHRHIFTEVGKRMSPYSTTLETSLES
ncbi:hypothetical protein EYC84_005051 [Monilinia fructicola]|uniref:Ubiquitin-conjugating enzyme E2-binding protein n=1 Tax=Monilinia fructicola TaxID=38448 RepID=A0A5M9K014_MONFR|nr:hypothetical protein EYC84_005051 [Monilinia fructicola]